MVFNKNKIDKQKIAKDITIKNRVDVGELEKDMELLEKGSWEA